MKTSLALIVTLAGLILVGCTFRAVKLEVPLASAEASELGQLRVGVQAGADGDSVAASQFASDLRQTGLFSEVVPAGSSDGLDLIAEVQRAQGIARCGTPDMLSRVTLGLWHGATGYSHDYQVEFRGAAGSTGFSFARRYDGVVGSGLLYLPRRASPRWSRPRRAGASGAVISALRSDLSRVAPDLLRLAGEPIQGVNLTPADQSLHRARPCGRAGDLPGR